MAGKGEMLRALFAAAVAAADPMRFMATHLPPRPAGRVIVIGAGKASARMAEAVEALWGPCAGAVVTRYGHGRPLQGVTLYQAAHPVPDAAGVQATQAIMALAAGAGEGDLVLVLLSGGASALLVAPVDGVTLADKQAVTQGLLASGAPIDAINTVRKHLSRVKGGQLAALAYPARVLCLMISDVAGDDPAFIGSGPTVGDDSTPTQALGVLQRWGVDVPASVARALAGPSVVIGTGDARLSRTDNCVVAAPIQSLQAAAELAKAGGMAVEILGDRVEGEAREVARAHAALALARAAEVTRPTVILSGGEVTVTRRGDGVGGPNAEYALALALALNDHPRIQALACDTDGVDGAAEVAGAVIGPDTLARAQAAGLDAAAVLSNNDAHSFFAKLGDQVVTGPTLTNVNDFRAILVLPKA